MVGRSKERCKRGTLHCLSEDDVMREELEKRVKRWLQQSRPPTVDSMRATNQEINTAMQVFDELSVGSSFQESQDILFHPDFIEWTTIQQNDGRLQGSQDRQTELLDALDDAKTAISILLKIPFS